MSFLIVFLSLGFWLLLMARNSTNKKQKQDKFFSEVWLFKDSVHLQYA